jgi:hypothetical protein
MNAAAEYPAEDHMVRAAVERYRAWLHGVVRELLADLGVDEPDVVADQLIMLRDGAMVHGHMENPGAVAGSIVAAGRVIISAHLGVPLPA